MKKNIHSKQKKVNFRSDSAPETHHVRALYSFAMGRSLRTAKGCHLYHTRTPGGVNGLCVCVAGALHRLRGFAGKSEPEAGGPGIRFD